MADMPNQPSHVRSLLSSLLAIVVGVGLAAWPAAAQAGSGRQAAAPARVEQAAPAAAPVAGVLNYAKVDSTVACGGALSPNAFAALKEAGYKSIVNLRAASEQGANVEAEQKGAADAGLIYIHLPFTSTAPDAAKLDGFLAAVAKPENQPMLIHCATGGRASMFWAVKRVMIDGWPVDKAMGELPDLGKHASQPLRTFVLDYLKSHGKTRP